MPVQTTRPRHSREEHHGAIEALVDLGQQAEDRGGLDLEHARRDLARMARALRRCRSLGHRRTPTSRRGFDASLTPPPPRRVEPAAARPASAAAPRLAPERAAPRGRTARARARDGPRGRRRRPRRRPRRAPAARRTRVCPPLSRSPAPGSCIECVTSKMTGDAVLLHPRERSHVDHQVAIAEGGAALDHRHALVAGRAHLLHRAQHVVGGHELALLDHHRASGAAGRDQEVGLAAEQRRNLEHRADLGRRLALRRLVHVGEHREPGRGAPPRASTRRPSASPGPRKLSIELRLALSNDDL